jgi:hypothetical protein
MKTGRTAGYCIKRRKTKYLRSANNLGILAEFLILQLRLSKRCGNPSLSQI